MNNRKTLIVRILFAAACICFWQFYAAQRNIMGFPTLDRIGKALVNGFTNPQRQMQVYLGHSLLMILKGLGIGAVLALICSALSAVSEYFAAIFQLVVSVFDLLPGVALLPILMITIGANDTAIIILVIHSVIWPMARNIMDGFRTTPRIYIEYGKNLGLSLFGLVIHVFIPASFAYILSGIKVGWARAWRGLISAEMIFGAAQTAGIGVYINNARTIWIDYASVYAAIALIILVGVVVEYGIFGTLEKKTIKRWGMVQA